MTFIEKSFQDFTDGIHSAEDHEQFRRVGDRVAKSLGFDWFAYLGLGEAGPVLISTYPKSWTDHYLAEHYEEVDPVIRTVRRKRNAFVWGGLDRIRPGSRRQHRFFDDALGLGIRSGMTIPIVGGFGRTAAFTFAANDLHTEISALIAEAADLMQLIGLSYHAHIDAKLGLEPRRLGTVALSQRERECLVWVARGKTVRETAEIVGLSARGVKFHLDNVRNKLGSNTVAQAVGDGMRRKIIR